MIALWIGKNHANKNHFDFLVTAIISLTNLNAVRAQGEPVTRVVSEKTYAEVLDAIFPREASDKKNTDWELVLRFIANDEPESQIIIRKTVKGSQVIHYKAAGLVFNQLGEWLTKNGQDDIPRMIATIDSTRQDFDVTKALVNGWRNGFFDAMGQTSVNLRVESGAYDRAGGWPFQLHGTNYQVWFTNKATKLHFSVTDSEIGDRLSGRLPLVRWMNQVRIAVEKL